MPSGLNMLHVKRVGGCFFILLWKYGLHEMRKFPGYVNYCEVLKEEPFRLNINVWFVVRLVGCLVD